MIKNVVPPFVIPNQCQSDMNELNNDHVLAGRRTLIVKFKQDMVEFVLKGSKEEVCDILLTTGEKRESMEPNEEYLTFAQRFCKRYTRSNQVASVAWLFNPCSSLASATTMGAINSHLKRRNFGNTQVRRNY